jgi:hypothetical protein
MWLVRRIQWICRLRQKAAGEIRPILMNLARGLVHEEDV